jgi:prolyl 4-hydroxylase
VHCSTYGRTVLSVAPRVFEIQNFLSETEVTHILELARGVKLSRSTTRAGAATEATTDDKTRTSKNSWIGREQTVIVDSIYRRAADLLQIHEACFRKRGSHERYLIANSTGPITERLQLVHYSVGQQYTPHHDFSVPDLRHGQASRFATLLLYLNEGMEGGQTSFPRWLNAHTSQILEVTPEVGKAVLFYK